MFTKVFCELLNNYRCNITVLLYIYPLSHSHILLADIIISIYWTSNFCFNFYWWDHSFQKHSKGLQGPQAWKWPGTYEKVEVWSTLSKSSQCRIDWLNKWFQTTQESPNWSSVKEALTSTYRYEHLNSVPEMRLPSTWSPWVFYHLWCLSIINLTALQGWEMLPFRRALGSVAKVPYALSSGSTHCIKCLCIGKLHLVRGSCAPLALA